MENIVEYTVRGRRALFTDPVTKVGGEKYTYPIPTYQALKGITESIYWKPTIVWHIDAVRVMNPIRYESINVKPMYLEGGNTLSIYTYLYDVEYQVRAHFEWNPNRPDLEDDHNENKHFFQMKRALERGGRRDIFLGTRECPGDVEPCHFGEGKGCYDDDQPRPLGLMFHGFDYADETGKDELASRFWTPIMVSGIVEFPRPEECDKRKHIRNYTPRRIGVSRGDGE